MEKDSKQRKEPEGENVKGRKCLKVGCMVLMIISSGIPIYFAYEAGMDDFGTFPTMANKNEVVKERLVLAIVWFMAFSSAAVFGCPQFIVVQKTLYKAPEHDINRTIKIIRFSQACCVLLILLCFAGLLIGDFNNIRIWTLLAFIDIVSLVGFQSILAIESGHEIEMLKAEEERILEKEKQNCKLAISEMLVIV